MQRILVTEKISQEGLDNLRNSGYEVDEKLDLSPEKLMEETVLPVCSPHLMEGPDAIKRPEDLARHTLLHDAGTERDPSCPDWSSWLRARGVENIDGHKGPHFNQSMLAIEAAATGRGVALAKKAIAAADLASGRLVAPFPDGSTLIDFAYFVVWPRGRTQTIESRTFIKWLKTEAIRDEIVGV